MVRHHHSTAYLAAIVRVRHLGNHRFAFALGHNSRQRRAVGLCFAPCAYLKAVDL